MSSQNHCISVTVPYMYCEHSQMTMFALNHSLWRIPSMELPFSTPVYSLRLVGNIKFQTQLSHFLYFVANVLCGPLELYAQCSYHSTYLYCTVYPNFLEDGFRVFFFSECLDLKKMHGKRITEIFIELNWSLAIKHTLL